MFEFESFEPKKEKKRKSKRQEKHFSEDKKKDKKLEKAEKYLENREKEFAQFNQVVDDLIVYEDLTYEDVLEEYEKNFSKEDAEIFADMWDNYGEIKRNVDQFTSETWQHCGENLNEYDYKVVERIFGFKPEGYFEVEDINIGVVITFYKKSDFVQSEGGEIDDEAEGRGEAFFDESNNINVMNIHKTLHGESKDTKEHEEKHVMTEKVVDMKSKWESRKDEVMNDIELAGINERNLGIILDRDEDVFTNYVAFNGIDEVLSYMFEDKSLTDIQEFLLAEKKDFKNAVYDYYAGLIEDYDDMLDESNQSDEILKDNLRELFINKMNELRPRYIEFIHNLMDEMDLVKTMMEMKTNLDRDRVYTWFVMDAKKSESAEDFLDRVQKLRKALYLTHK